MAMTVIFSIYGVFLLIGAYFGWKAGSKISLFAGLLSGIAVLLCVYWMQSAPKPGLMAFTGLTGLLSVMFLMRLVKTQSFMPSGMLLVVSLIVLATALWRLTIK